MIEIGTYCPLCGDLLRKPKLGINGVCKRCNTYVKKPVFLFKDNIIGVRKSSYKLRFNNQLFSFVYNNKLCESCGVLHRYKKSDTGFCIKCFIQGV